MIYNWLTKKKKKYNLFIVLLKKKLKIFSVLFFFIDTQLKLLFSTITDLLDIFLLVTVEQFFLDNYYACVLSIYFFLFFSIFYVAFLYANIFLCGILLANLHYFVMCILGILFL